MSQTLFPNSTRYSLFQKSGRKIKPTTDGRLNTDGVLFTLITRKSLQCWVGKFYVECLKLYNKSNKKKINDLTKINYSTHRGNLLWFLINKINEMSYKKKKINKFSA